MAFTYGTANWCTNADSSSTHIYQVRLGYELQSQDEVNNRSVIKLRLQARSTSSSYKPYGYSQTSHIDGTTFSSATYDFRSTNTWQTFATTGNITVEHNADGTYNTTKSGYFTSTATGTRPKRGDASVQVVLPTIARASNITVNDANIGSSTNITINKANTSFTTTLEYSTNNSTWTTIVTKTSNQVYGWTVPTSFYSLIPNAKTMVCYFRATTYSGDTNIGTTTAQATFTATGNPVINSATATDTNSVTTGLTNDNTKMIRYASNVQISISVSGQNSATISSVSVNGTNVSLSGTNPKTGSITFNSASTNSFQVVTTDSRGYSTSQTLTMTMVDYTALTLNATVSRNQPTDGKVNIIFNGNYFNGDFRTGLSNTLSVEYRYQEQGGSWSSWTTLNYTLSGNTFSGGTGSNPIENINYTKIYYFEIRAIDRVRTKTISGITISKGEPIYWWDDDGLYVNGTFKTKSGDLVVDSLRSKNLIDINKLEPGGVSNSTGEMVYRDQVTVNSRDNKTGSISFTTNSAWRGVVTDFIEVESGARYQLSEANNYSNIVKYAFCFNSSKTYLGSDYIAGINQSTLITIPNNTKYIRIIFETNVANVGTINLSGIQFEKGDAVTSFSPYHDYVEKDYYSSPETRIASWINGRPLYRKVYTGTTSTITNGFFTITDSNLTNVETLVKFEYFIKDGTVIFPIPNVGDRICVSYLQTSYGGIGIAVQSSSYYSSFSNKPYTIILEYTKTTD